jgi:hypothetical protein
MVLSSIKLLEETLGGNNQFTGYGPFLVVLVLICTAVFQVRTNEEDCSWR